MIIAIRINGQVGIPEFIKETLNRLRLRRKYSAVLLNDTIENRKILGRVRNFISYGEIDKSTLEELIKKRAKKLSSSEKPDAKSVMALIEKKGIKNSGIKPFFRLHPPRGGIDSKKHFGVSRKAVLGDNKEKINELVRRML